MGEQVTHSISEAVEASTAGIQLFYFDKPAFDAVLQSSTPGKQKAELFAQLARFNALYMVARAGSGHLGSSFSSLDIITWLYLNVLKPEDRYFSSKGHDSPGLYAVQTALGIIPFGKIHALRRLDGLPGHPDVSTPGAHTNTGSLGMGVSKAKGFLFADDLLGKPKGRLFVLTGDGELQEGQFWESLISASNRRDNRLTVIVDHNKLQSDTYVSGVGDLGDLEAKFKAFGWDVCRCNGHDYLSLESHLSSSGYKDRPMVIIADTIKGRGVSFMEHTAMAADQEYYHYHSGAPSPEDYHKASKELLNNISQLAVEQGIGIPGTIGISFEPLKLPTNSERMIPAYTDAILAEARTNPKLVALNADLILDTGLIPFKKEFPERFVECGIAEQDMVSQAGTMALAGLLPVVHSFACFLTSRASEQIYNNCTQGGKVIYVGSLAGLLPAGPGHSHQAVRDITAMSAMPGMTLIEPANAEQLKQAFIWSVRNNSGSTYLRLTSIPYEVWPELFNMCSLIEGQGHVLRDGADATIIAAGPIMTQTALQVADQLAKEAQQVTVISMPWLSSFDSNWFERQLTRTTRNKIVILENHYQEMGFGTWLIDKLMNINFSSKVIFKKIGLKELPRSGQNKEVLEYHGMDVRSICKTVSELIKKL